MEEIWKPVVGYKRIYAVSNFGRVKRIAPGPGTRPGRILKMTLIPKGYLNVCLYKNRCGQLFGVHRIVANAFIGPYPLNHQINHVNGDKKDNRPENLEYVTPSENLIHAYQVLNKWHIEGEKHPMSKLTEQDISEIRALYKSGNHSQWNLAHIFNVHQSTIWRIVHCKTWTCI